MISPPDSLQVVHNSLLLRVAWSHRDDARLFLIEGLHRRVLRQVFACEVVTFDHLRERFPRLSPEMLSTILERAEKATFLRHGRHYTGSIGYHATKLGIRVLDTETIPRK